MKLELREYQKQAIASIYNYYSTGNDGNIVIVIPTAGGKSLVIAKFIEEVLTQWPNQRFLILSHVKELLMQNYQELIGLYPSAPVGMYSAGLKIRQVGKPITIAGVQSVYKKAAQLGWQDIIIIDECHLCGNNDESMYRSLIADLQKINKHVKIIGFSATPYRLKTGLLTSPGGLFDEFAYEVSVADLVSQGFLSPVISKAPKTQADLSSVAIRGGEYVAAEMEKVLDNDDLTLAAIREIETYMSDRRSIMVFCSGVVHAEHVKDKLIERGFTAEVVTGETEDMFRAQTVSRFKSGEVRFLVNVNVFTTGFNARNVDGIVLLRGTKSHSLYVQAVGRGMRLSPETGKTNCMVLDFCGNIERLGPIDKITIKQKGGKEKKVGEVTSAPVKICEKCQSVCLISFKECPDCGNPFPIEAPVHDIKASTKPIMQGYEPPERHMVTKVHYAKHHKKGDAVAPPTLKVSYEIGLGGNLMTKLIHEWVCFEHVGYARGQAIKWWVTAHKDYKTPSSIVVPSSVDEAIERANELRPTTEVSIQKDGKFDRVVSRVYGEYSQAVVKTDEIQQIDFWEDEVPF
jgi:DNA repair protein RadD